MPNLTCEVAAEAVLEQSGVIPYRWRAGRLEVMLVTRSSGPGWTTPKGHIEPDLTASQSAAKEAFEEAGVIGQTDPRPVGRFIYRKRGTARRVTMFPLHVRHVLQRWPEMDCRTRNWVPLAEARWLVARAEMGSLIDLWARMLHRDTLAELDAAEVASRWAA